MSLSQEKLAKALDHTLLKPQATEQDLLAVCREALTLDVATVCVSPVWVPLVARELRGSTVKPITVIGFPHGVNTTHTKLKEAEEAVALGAQEIDMVIHTGAIHSGMWQRVSEEVEQLYRLLGPNVPLKVIFETGLLDQQQIIRLSRICGEIGVAFVKTSTGFGPRGASLEDMALMKEGLQGFPSTLIKASGGIRSRSDALAMLEAGASRIGTSSSAAILKNESATGTY